MDRRALIGIGLSLTVMGAPVHAVGEAPMQPSTPWRVVLDGDQCLAFRSFGTGDDAVTMRVAGTGFSRQVTLMGKPVPTSELDLFVFTWTDVQTGRSRIPAYAFRTKDGQRVVQWADDAAAMTDEWVKGQRVTVNVGRWSRVFPIGRFGDVMGLLQDCENELMTRWGVSTVQRAQYKRLPQPIKGPGGWLVPGDYPFYASHAGLLGTLVLALDVAEDGSVSDCTLLRSSSVKDFDRIACEKNKLRARFVPALDANGVPVKSRYVVRWSFEMIK